MKNLDQKMAQALIDIHNLLPTASVDAISQEYQERSQNCSEDDEEPTADEVVEDLYSNLLADLWEVLHRFPHNELENVLKEPVQAR